MSIAARTPTLIATALLTLSAGFSSPANAQAAALSISQEPLYITNRIKPAFIMAIDDSGSMQWEALFPTQDGRATWNGAQNSFYHPTELAPNGQPRPYRNTETGNGNGQSDFLELFPFTGRGTPRQTFPPLPNFGFARSHEFNPAAFNPYNVYEPWAKADRSLWPNATRTAALVDPRNAGGVAFDVTADRQLDNNTEWLFDFRVGMRIPAGTVYSRNAGNNCNFGGTQIGTTGWWTVDANTTVTVSCRSGVRYYPATFYLTSPTFPGYTATPLQIVNPVGGPPNTTLYRYEIRPGNMTAEAYEAAIQNFANYFSYYRNRNLSIIAAVTKAFVDIDFMRVGAFTINNRNTVTMYDMGVQADRNAFYTLVTAFNGNSGTPNRFAVDHLGNQFRRTGAGAPVQLACQMNAGMLFTDGYSNGGGPTVGIGNLDGGLGPPFADTFDNKKGDIVARHYMQNIRSDLPAGLVRVPPACATANPDPRLDCRTDPHMNFYGVTLGAIGTVYGVNAAATADPYANPPAWPGRCDDCLQAVDELWQATLIGRGRYINATSPQAISQAMNDVVNAVLDSTQPVGTPPVAGARVGTDSATYQTGFAVRNNARDWVGSLQAFRINADGSIGTQLWSAEPLLPSASSRNILAMRTPGPTATRSVVPFLATNFGTTESERATAIGVSLSSFTANYTAGSTMTDAFNYLRGDQSREQTNTVPLGFRSRSGRLGDIVNSSAEVETKRSFYPAFDALPGAEGSAYRAYRETKLASFTNSVYVGANAGMLHAFNADTGAELFSYIPNGAIGQMGLLLARNYQHRYFVDGQINVTDAVINGNWGTVLLGNMGRGGRSVFAINVTDPTSVDAGKVMWELPTDDNDLGLGLGRVEVMYGEDGAWYAVFGNGLNSTNANPVLYLVNLSTGVVTRRITADDGGNLTNGLTRIALADVNGNGRVDAVYGGDFQGNLWKFDLSSTSNSSWGVGLAGNPLARARDINGDPQPITGGVTVARGPSGGVMVSFGTGRYLTDTDAVAGGTQQLHSFYGVWDRGTVSGITRDSLRQQQILTQFGTGSNLGRTLTNNRVDYATQNGWYLDLRVGSTTPNGERMIGDPRVIGQTITIPTSEPSGDTQCAPGLRSWGYRLDLFSGGPVLNRMERPGGNAVCPTTGCGGLLVQASGAPVTGSSVVQPQRPCRRGIDPECPAIADPAVIAATCGSPNPADGTFNPDYDTCVDTATAGGNEALVCSISNPIGTQDFGGEPQVCGRQSWRQVR
ncbi:PilC/PilY family type IV pilus protein [Silanimonas sp.]|uniref:pilus assembly protein n=1 Tax=Silanimonas sp. TaxID=1929290 RepID=UPI0022BD1710|nr:PilC/PilY family type IV pilus protein [Silanimonas sp.]MCZ8164821.1 PilC/PilY family type IV pilus protein [Silanimonas sp.]